MRTTNRTHLSLCVDGAGGLTISDIELNTVRQALEDAIASASVPLPAEYSQRGVRAGCPPARALAELEAGRIETARLDEYHNGSSVILGNPGAPPEPSPHLLFIYFVTPEVYAASIAAEPYLGAEAEDWARASTVYIRRWDKWTNSNPWHVCGVPDS